MSNNLRTVLALSHLPKVGRVRLRNLLELLKSDATRDLEIAEVVDRYRDRLPPVSPVDLDAAISCANAILERCESLGIDVHPSGSPSYPSELNRLTEPPAILFSLGDFSCKQRPRVAVIGTRNPTPWGLKTSRACARRIAEARGVVVSGLALGIDAAAHAACVESNGPTWAVLAHGLHTVSPSSNRELAQRIIETGGALISEYAPGEPAQRHYFVQRDRIQAGLSDAVLVIESDINGGAMHTVRYGHEAGVPVWVTFPDTQVQAAENSSPDLPEPQRGTWQLLITKRASRVPTVRALDTMLDRVTRPRVRPPDQPLLAR